MIPANFILTTAKPPYTRRELASLVIISLRQLLVAAGDKRSAAAGINCLSMQVQHNFIPSQEILDHFFQQLITKDNAVTKENFITNAKAVGVTTKDKNTVSNEEICGRRCQVQPSTTKHTTTEKSYRRRSDSATRSRSISPALPPKTAEVTASKKNGAPCKEPERIIKNIL
ncbi:hypothetical protein BZA05DRAFT_422408 [Tricharina praecox]|uniref:uncharacterized protein n=1 Tax=Tricharina praecox TaxID=43433 RepID=UPI002221059A|nr:uncharacterized protein BZA05DRAFT_422408 [Tricharina praecox]KAI5842768.1 hypothetical protein BZA05DRAFT_422408 [Tricharina praecox]